MERLWRLYSVRSVLLVVMPSRTIPISDIIWLRLLLERAFASLNHCAKACMVASTSPSPADCKDRPLDIPICAENILEPGYEAPGYEAPGYDPTASIAIS